MHRLSALLCLALLSRGAPAHAQTEIHRCIGTDGNAVFTDQPCAALQATPVGPRAAAGVDSVPPATPPPVLCAASRAGLRQSVIDAFAARDANRLAGLMLWDGYGRGAAITDIRSLGELMKQPLLDIGTPSEPAAASTSLPALANDPFAMSVPHDPLPPDDQLILHVAGNDGSGSPRELRFHIVRQAGCLWLRDAS